MNEHFWWYVAGYVVMGILTGAICSRLKVTDHEVGGAIVGFVWWPFMWLGFIMFGIGKAISYLAWGKSCD